MSSVPPPYRYLFLGIAFLLLSLSCNLLTNGLNPAVTPNYAMPTPSEPFAWQTATISMAADVLAVQITDPLDGAQLAGGNTIPVNFQAGGGPFAEFDLLVDGTQVSQIVGTIPNTPVFSGYILWSGITDGPHQLIIRAWTLEKQIAETQVNVFIGTGTAPQAGAPTTQPTSATNQQPSPLPTSGSASVGNMQIRFVNVSDGGELPITLDEKQGKPWVTVQVEVTGPPCVGVQLQEDSIVVASADNNNGVSPFTAELTWSPRHGGGKYVLFVGAGDPNKQAWANSQIQVNVTGLPAYTPSPPPASQQEASQIITQKYLETWKLDVPYPALRRYDNPDPAAAAWISAAYIADRFYVLHLYDDRHITSDSILLNQPDTTRSPVCRPAGTYRILVVFVDYGNTGVSTDIALKTLQSGTTAINTQYTDFAKQHGLAAPILQLQVTGAYLLPPPSPGNLVTIEQVKALTGYDPAQFDLLAQVDLDSQFTYGKTNGLTAAGGLAIYGCTGSGTQRVNMWSSVSSADQIQNLPATLLIHELDHLMGWMHDWPCGNEGSPPETCNQEPPYLLFGWLDTNGDGQPEILSPKPYGAK